MIKLRDDQLEIMKYTGGRMAVPSVAGAGKTTTIAMLAKQLIKSGLVKGKKVLIVTYMNSAVANFKSRISKFLSEDGIEDTKSIEVMTLHSLAHRILKDKGGEFDDIDVLDDTDRGIIVKNIVDYWVGLNKTKFKAVLEREDRYEDFKVKFYEISGRIISYFKSSGYAYMDLLPFVKKLDDNSMLKWCIEIYGEYSMELNSRGKMDYDDLILCALRLLQKDETLKIKFQKRWAYIFEDEAQDSNPLQEAMLNILSDDNKNLVRVGDSNQAIMSTFTSSSPSHFRNFTNSSDVVRRVLKYSSRNSKDIIDIANHLVEFSNEISADIDVKSEERLEKQMICPAFEDGKLKNPCPQGYFIDGRVYDTKIQEIEDVCRKAWKESLSNPDKTIAILVRSNSSIDDICICLKKLQANYMEISSFPDYRSRANKIIGKVLDYMINPENSSKLIEAVNYIYYDGKMGEDIKGFLKKENIEDLLLPKDRDELNAKIRNAVSFGDAERLNMALGNFGRLISTGDRPVEEIVMCIAEIFEFDREMTAIAQRAAYEAEQSRKYNISWDINSFVNGLKLGKGTYRYYANLVYDRKGFEPQRGVINVCTYHKSKGLEWDIVFLTSLTRGSFPNRCSDKFIGEYWYLKEKYRNPEARIKNELNKLTGSSNNDDPVIDSRMEVIAEGLRLLYVGITRAREKVYMSAWRRDNRFETEESLFFRELKKLVDERRKQYGSSSGS